MKIAPAARRLRIMGWLLRKEALGLLLATLASLCHGQLALERSIDLPGPRGRLDHLAVDPTHRRVFVAALESGSVEVVDFDAGRRVGRLEHLEEPQGLVFLGPAGRLLVADGEGGKVQAFDGSGRTAASATLPDADNLRLDAAANELYVAHGHALAVLDPASLQVLRRFPLPGHPEGFELSPTGPEVYLNVPTVHAVIVLDRHTGRRTAVWDVAPAARNFPAALDAKGHRLFVGTRQPAALQVFDVASGHRATSVPLCGDADDLFWDAGREQLFAVCGSGEVWVLRFAPEGGLRAVQRVVSAAGARTGLFVAAWGVLLVAAPAAGTAPARLLVFSIR